jgi:polyphosphate kinase
MFNYNKFEAYTIKLTRDAELDIDNDLSKSFLEKISEGVSERSKGQPVRFVFDHEIPKDLLKYIIKKLGFDDLDTVIPGGRYHNFKDFMAFPNIGGPHLEYEPAPSCGHPLINKHESMFKLIASRDISLHYPYQKFDHFVDFLREASMDPKVKSIKITLYRVSRNSKVINALINAARNGKQVIVVIELQARFDEKSNIYWSKKLEEVGATVMFGIKGLKIHCKLVQVTRKEGKKLKTYSVISTGNFHEGNTKVYTDIALFTCNKSISQEVEKLFSFFDNPYWNYDYSKLFISPLYMRKKLIKLIDNEIANAKAGKDAYILLKINNLVDSVMVQKLYDANNAGVKIRLLVRGICCIRPGVKGLSENITALSIVDRYLEHSRIFVFCNNNDELYFISSADWMTRNLDHRVEVTCPIFDEDLKKEIRKLLEIQFSDNVKARIVNENQDNQYYTNDAPPVHSQHVIYNYYKQKFLEANQIALKH